jgi:glycosyltransferase involved in cell wall biosynthesis
MTKSPSVTLLILTLNEIDGLRAIMPRVKQEWVDQILILDGNSTDGTIEYAREQGFEIYIQKRKGIRLAYNEVMEHVRGDVVLTFSPDGNSIPELIPALIEKMSEGYDMVIASRYLGEAKSEDDSLVTGFGNWLFNRLINTFHGGHYTDCMVIYRAWRKALFYELDLDKDESHWPEKLYGTVISIEPLLSIRAAKRRLKIGEIPGDEPPRIGGVAKLQLFRWGASYLHQVIRELWYWR